ncbi:hypothetical protein DPMN_146453 [Dreissena polymorpha]|uniref:Uncharacterized protein n=1 Tax=Dreissena polymorpha TaxID=45954 RepID=A0A9D4IYF4_DREPO|nr:hypothetical protein DPMN_146453 [Dreissena polymorpha]
MWMIWPRCTVNGVRWRLDMRTMRIHSRLCRRLQHRHLGALRIMMRQRPFSRGFTSHSRCGPCMPTWKKASVL